MEQEEFDKIINEAVEELKGTKSIIVRTGRLGAINFVKAVNEKLGITEPIDESQYPEGFYLIDDSGLQYEGKYE